MSRMDEFRQFVKEYPLLKEAVKAKERSWQDIYEEWVLYGEASDSWVKYKETETTTPSSNQFSFDGIKNMLGNIKKVDPEKINNTLNSVQKVLQIAQSVTGVKQGGSVISNQFSDWWD